MSLERKVSSLTCRRRAKIDLHSSAEGGCTTSAANCRARRAEISRECGPGPGLQRASSSSVSAAQQASAKCSNQSGS